MHDALVGDGVLAMIADSAERIDVGKRPGRPTPQEMISTLLVELGRQGKRVVRLKGGDPFVFGRGGEEAAALAGAGVPFEVVPGITSSVAAPAAAGIPVTHRGVSAAFTVVTGHRREGEPDVDWRSLAAVGGTIVVLMGVSQRAQIAAELVAGGLAPTTPVAAIESATTDAQVVGRWTLEELADADVHSPAVIVIGAVAGFRIPPRPTDSSQRRFSWWFPSSELTHDDHARPFPASPWSPRHGLSSVVAWKKPPLAPRPRRTPSKRTSSRNFSSKRSRSTGCAASTDAVTMLDRRLELDPQVALRPEPFGALAYHYGNRKLIFLKHPDMVQVVQALGDHDTLADTLRACRDRRSPVAVVRIGPDRSHPIGDAP